MATDLILGTAGHIDHGKTALVRALTGVDTDRLPEEKKRGITIDLGFAALDLGEYRLGIVDVPGHERFVRNMLAGATGIDLALLVVAADDSVKPQTREHLEILRLLRIEHGLIALSKCDVAAADWIDLVEEEIRDLVADTFLSQAPIVRTSAHTGAGIDALKKALCETSAMAARSPRRANRVAAPLRLPIDRTFTVAGHGTVVTGSVLSGTARVGDELRLEPGGVAVRVRGIESHGAAIEAVHAGQRAAVNLAGVHHDQVRRGQELAAPGHLVPAKLFTVEIELLAGAPRPLKHRARVRCHLGTTELMATAVLLEGERIEPGASALAQLFLGEPAVATWGQPFVIRSESPMVTIGGGRVLDPTAVKIRRGVPAALAHARGLASDDPLVRASAAFYFAAFRTARGSAHETDLARSAGLADPAVRERLAERGELRALDLPPNRTVSVHRDALDEIFARVEALLDKEHRRHPLATALDRSRVAARLHFLGSDPLIEAVLHAMQRDGRLLGRRNGVALPDRGPQLSNNERKLLDEIIERYRAAEFQPPTVAELTQQATKNQAAVPQLVALAAAEGTLIGVSAEYYLHADSEHRLRAMLAERLTDGAGMTMSQIRELLGTTRKYAVPICEYLDRVGFTRRDGDLRMLAVPAKIEPIAP